MHLFVRFAVGVLEVVGGILGVAAIAVGAYSTRSIEPMTGFFAALYLTMIVAGIGLLRGYRFGGALSLLVQCAQLLRIAAAGCMYHFWAPAAAWLMLGEYGMNVSFAVGGEFACSAVTAGPTMLFGVNLVAAAALTMLLATRVPKNANKKKKDKRRRLAFA